jgi:hypothetical protein
MSPIDLGNGNWLWSKSIRFIEDLIRSLGRSRGGVLGLGHLNLGSYGVGIGFRDLEIQDQGLNLKTGIGEQYQTSNNRIRRLILKNQKSRLVVWTSNQSQEGFRVLFWVFCRNWTSDKVSGRPITLQKWVWSVRELAKGPGRLKTYLDVQRRVGTRVLGLPRVLWPNLRVAKAWGSL